MDPICIWYAIVGAVLLTFLIQFIHRRFSRRQHRHSRHFLELGHDREIFYIPGDTTDNDAFDDDDC